MKFDPDLMRKILLAVEDQPFPVTQELEVAGYGQDAIGFHVVQLRDAGLVKAEVLFADDDIVSVMVSSLTMEGQKLLD